MGKLAALSHPEAMAPAMLKRLAMIDPDLRERFPLGLKVLQERGVITNRTLTDLRPMEYERVVQMMLVLLIDLAYGEMASLAKLSAKPLVLQAAVTAALAKRLAEHATTGNVGAAYFCGIVHNLGVPVLACLEPDRYTEVLERTSSDQEQLHQAEAKAFGCGHPEAGLIAAQEWGLGRASLEAIAKHHESIESLEGNVLCVSVAAIFAHHLGFHGIDATKPKLDSGIEKLRLMPAHVGALASVASEEATLVQALLRPAALLAS